MKKETIKKILIDYRENHRVKNAKHYYRKHQTEEARLNYGDFLFVGDQGTRILFEYKTGQDFINSIRNNHLHNQTIEACTHYKYKFIIVECYSINDMLKKYYWSTGIDVSRKQVNGAIASLNTISTVLFVQKEDEAYDLMERQAMKILEDKPLLWKFSKKTINPALNYLSSVKGLSKQAHLLCKKLNLNNLEDLMNLTEEDLTTVDGIGKKKARVILKSIRRI